MSIPTTTPAVASIHAGPVDATGSFVDITLDVTPPTGHDLLVEVHAVSVNPVDGKVRACFDPQDEPKVLGWDAAGVVLAVGPEVTGYTAGDEVFYAGSIARSGSNAGLQLVDERIVGRKPATLDFAEAAALPLTSITAWEVLYERLHLTPESTGTLLVVGGAGGVGSMLTQLARRIPGVTVVATASRPETADWVRSMGAHHVVDHHHLVELVREVAPDGVDWIFTAFSEGNVAAFADLLKVRGEVVAIDDPVGLDLLALKTKSITWHWELMFTVPLFEPASTAQRQLLDEVSRLVDAGELRTTLTQRLGPLSADTLREAHRHVESSSTIGKVVLTIG